MPDPKVFRMQLGRELRELREAKETASRQDAARKLGCDVTKISRIESGRATTSPFELDLLLTLYEVEEKQQQRLLDMADAARKRGTYGKVPVWSRGYVGTIAEVDALKIYYGELIPGPLQIHAYARAVIASSAIVPEGEVDRLAGNRERQRAILTSDDPPDTEIVLGEAALRREVGGTGILREQLKYVREVAAQEQITVQLLPFSAGAHPALDAAFTLLYLTEPQLRYVYLEDLTSGGLRDDEHHVSSYELTFDRLKSTALGKDETLSALDRVLNDLG